MARLRRWIIEDTTWEIGGVASGATLIQRDISKNFEFSVPLAVLGINPQPELRLKGDIGVLRGDASQTSSRVYWANKATKHDLGCALGGRACARALGHLRVPASKMNHARIRRPKARYAWTSRLISERIF